MLCDPCGAEPNAGECDAAFLRYYFNQQTGACEEFIWGGCGGTVPFDTLEECESSCDTNSFINHYNSGKEIVKITDILGRDIDSSFLGKILIYIYDDGSVEKIHLLNQ